MLNYSICLFSPIYLIIYYSNYILVYYFSGQSNKAQYIKGNHGIQTYFKLYSVNEFFLVHLFARLSVFCARHNYASFLNRFADFYYCC